MNNQLNERVFLFWLSSSYRVLILNSLLASSWVQSVSAFVWIKRKTLRRAMSHLSHHLSYQTEDNCGVHIWTDPFGLIVQQLQDFCKHLTERINDLKEFRAASRLRERQRLIFQSGIRHAATNPSVYWRICLRSSISINHVFRALRCQLFIDLFSLQGLWLDW